jgi:diguanylate cyclase
MVETNDKEGRLRQRVMDLSWQLDRAEARTQKLRQAYGQGLASLAGLLGGHLKGRSGKSLTKLKKTALKPDSRPGDVSAAVEELKNAILQEAPAPRPGAEVAAAAAPAPAHGGSGAARHVALALLEGLRLGEPAFDQRLERAISDITGHMEADQVRPAMARISELLESHRETQEGRLRETEQALKELAAEVLSTQEELAAAFEQAQQGMSQATADYDHQVTSAVGRLAQDLSSAGDLEDLKHRALERLKEMREGVKARQEREHALLSLTRRQLEQVRGNLGQMRERLRAAEKAGQRLSQEALTDPLTRLWNKRALSQRLPLALANPGDAPVSLIVFDIDNFKGINDTWGHQAGDKALVAIAERSGQSLRRLDALFRYAGDEFVVLLTQTPLETAREVAERIRKSTCAIRFTYGGKGDQHLTVSLGVAQAGEDETSVGLFERADQALLKAKRAGRDRVEV